MVDFRPDFWRESGNISVAQDFLKSGVCFLLTNMLINPLTSSSLFFPPRIPKNPACAVSCLTCMIISLTYTATPVTFTAELLHAAKKKSKKRFYGREINENCLFLQGSNMQTTIRFLKKKKQRAAKGAAERSREKACHTTSQQSITVGSPLRCNVRDPRFQAALNR